MGAKHKSRIGGKFGKLTLMDYRSVVKNQRRTIIYTCLCDCGNKKALEWRVIVSGGVKTCGKCPKPIGNQHPEWEGFGEISRNLWNTYRHGAKARGFKFRLSIEYAWQLFLKQNRKCALTGWDLYFPKSYKTQTDKTASLDRIDSTKGYVPGNVQWVHRDVNKLKKNMDNDRFIDLCCAIARNLK